MKTQKLTIAVVQSFLRCFPRLPITLFYGTINSKIITDRSVEKDNCYIFIGIFSFRFSGGNLYAKHTLNASFRDREVTVEACDAGSPQYCTPVRVDVKPTIIGSKFTFFERKYKLNKREVFTYTKHISVNFD